jgi:hypothetical protein
VSREDASAGWGELEPALLAGLAWPGTAALRQLLRPQAQDCSRLLTAALSRQSVQHPGQAVKPSCLALPAGGARAIVCLPLAPHSSP